MEEIRRLELNIEFDESSLHVFHTNRENGYDPGTIININGKEFEGTIDYKEDENLYILKVKRKKYYDDY